MPVEHFEPAVPGWRNYARNDSVEDCGLGLGHARPDQALDEIMGIDGGGFYGR